MYFPMSIHCFTQSYNKPEDLMAGAVLHGARVRLNRQGLGNNSESPYANIATKASVTKFHPWAHIIIGKFCIQLNCFIVHFHPIFQEGIYENFKLFQVLKSFKNKCVLGEGRQAELHNFQHCLPCSLLFPKADEQRSVIYTE